MNWNNLVMTCRYSDQHILALLMSRMWLAAANSGRADLLSNLTMNQMDANGVASALDWTGIPVPEDLVSSLQG